MCIPLHTVDCLVRFKPYPFAILDVLKHVEAVMNNGL